MEQDVGVSRLAAGKLMAQGRSIRSGIRPIRRGPLSRVLGRGLAITAPSGVLALSVLIGGFGLAGCTETGPVMRNLPTPVYVIRERPLPPPPPAPPAPRPITNRTIVVDAGHGGKDPGALPKFRGQLREKDLNLDIASQVGSRLASRGARVVMTRTTDSFLSLEDRAGVADRYRADLFLSIHADSSPKRYISGAGIHIHRQAQMETMRLAQCIATSFRRNGISCRGIFRNNFHVLREHNSPGVLIECGYMSNAADAQRLNDAAYRSRLATAIAEGVADHFAR